MNTKQIKTGVGNESAKNQSSEKININMSIFFLWKQAGCVFPVL